MRKLLSVIFVFAAFFGCKKPSQDENRESNKNRLRLETSRTLNSNGHYIFHTNTYSEDGLIKKEVSKDETTGLNLIQEYYYNGKTLTYSIISTDSRPVSKINYAYTNDRLKTMDYLEFDSRGNTNLNFTKKFDYVGMVLNKISTYSDQDALLYFETFVFDEDKNITESNVFSASGNIQNRSEYLYDMESNPFLGNPDLNQLAVGLSKNNITRVKYTDYLNPGSDSEVRFEYAYNNEKYPIEKFLAGQPNSANKTTFSYQKY